MFKTAATKIAHNSTLPALGGNQDLRPLQDLITAEKAVLISLQKLSVDYSKASEAVRTWGLSEGDDLGDILSASTTILNHFSSALSQYAAYGHTMRDQLKTIRTREEALEELKRRRRTVMRKADDAEKKLSKMSPEHKNFAMQTETLNRLRDEIRIVDSDIMTEEAALGDFKRTTTRLWMGLKFGGLLECCEKGKIAGEFGKLIISEISEEITQPGLPRSLYYGHSKTESLVAEAHRHINDVTLSTVPTVGFRDRRQYDQGPGDDHGAAPWSPNAHKPQPLPPIQSRTSSDYLPAPRPFAGYGDAPGSPTSTGASFASQPYSPHPQGTGPAFSQTLPHHHQGGYSEQSVDDFGVNNRLSSDTNSSRGRFATFPVKTRPPGIAGGYRLQDPPSLSSRDEMGPSLSASIAEALDDKGSLETAQATEGTHGQGLPPWAARYGTGPPSAYGTEETAKATEGGQSPSKAPWSNLPPPSTGSSSLPLRPPGAARPDVSNPWAGAKPEDTLTLKEPTHTRNVSQLSENDDALLAYMTAADEEARTGEKSPVSPIDKSFLGPKGAGSPAPEEEQQLSRHVRFGEVADVDTETEKRSLEERKFQEANLSNSAKALPTEPVRTSNERERGLVEVPPVNENDGNTSPSSGPTGPKNGRVPPPTFNPEEDEKSLNAAAAREITRELEALKANRPTPSAMGQRSQTEPTVDRGRLPNVPASYSDYSNVGRDVSPLAPPSAPFANRSVSPHPYAELNPNAPAPYAAQPYTPAQSYAQSHQHSSSFTSPPNISPAQAYAQSYQSSTSYSQPQTPEAHVSTSNLPPRFQALNQSLENQVPPRFQAAGAHSPGSPTASQIPPRFQAGHSSQIPTKMNLPEQQDPRLSPPRAPETPYRTPPEYPRSLGVRSSFTRSTTSLNSSPVMPPPAGARTISAAAFKRPRNMSSDNAPGGDPFSKKTLPSSVHPARDSSGLGASAGAGVAPVPAPHGAPGGEADDDDYDYIGAYVNNSNPASPKRGEFGTAAESDAVPPGGGGGYGEGRFATDLEGSSLR